MGEAKRRGTYEERVRMAKAVETGHRDPCADSTEGYCRSCGSLMTKEESLRQDCGGDCLLCMVKTGDPDCRQRALRLVQEME